MSNEHELFLRFKPPTQDGPGPASFGLEDFLTEALGATLAADASSQGRLIPHLLEELLGIRSDGAPKVATLRGAGVRERLTGNSFVFDVGPLGSCFEPAHPKGPQSRLRHGIGGELRERLLAFCRGARIKMLGQTQRALAST